MITPERIVRLCLATGTTPARLRELAADPRGRADLRSPDPMISEARALALAAWKADSAAALGWSPQGVAMAHLEPRAKIAGYLEDALEALEGGDR